MTRIEKKFNESKRNSLTKILEFPGQIISPNPIFSEGYCDCNSVILLGKDIAGVSHYNLNPWKSISSRLYLPRLIRELRKESDGLKAVLIGGDESHFKLNKELLDFYDIPVIADYLDKWNSFEINKDKVGYKDLVVVPKTKEVFLYVNQFKTNKKEYIQLN